MKPPFGESILRNCRELVSNVNAASRIRDWFVGEMLGFYSIVGPIFEYMLGEEKNGINFLKRIGSFIE